MLKGFGEWLRIHRYICGGSDLWWLLMSDAFFYLSMYVYSKIHDKDFVTKDARVQSCVRCGCASVCLFVCQQCPANDKSKTINDFSTLQVPFDAPFFALFHVSDWGTRHAALFIISKTISDPPSKSQTSFTNRQKCQYNPSSFFNPQYKCLFVCFLGPFYFMLGCLLTQSPYLHKPLNIFSLLVIVTSKLMSRLKWDITSGTIIFGDCKREREKQYRKVSIMPSWMI